MILKNGKRIDGCTDTLPVGTVQPFLGLTPPLGYLVCQGQLISKVEYPELYNICKSTFGAETETHFYLPDLRGRTIAGYHSGDDTFNILGLRLGEKTHLLTELESGIREHTHAMPLAHTAGVGAHQDIAVRAIPSSTDEEFRTGHVTGLNPDLPRDYGSPFLTGTDTANAMQAHNNIQPTMVLNWIVKATMLIPEYFIVENTLTSTSTSNALSAAQGKILDNKIVELKNAQNIIGSSYKYTLTTSGEQPSGGWYPIGNEYTTGIIPAGRYIIRYGATVSSVATIITFNPYLDGGRTGTATRTTVAGPGSEGLLVSGQNIIWREFTTDATHTVNTYVYTNGATTASAIEVEFIRIG